MTTAPTIRPAIPADADALAAVHVHTWREAYADLLSDAWRAAIPAHLERRRALWTRVTADPAQLTLVADVPGDGVVGFVNGAHARDADLADHAEVWSLYLRAAHHGRGLGYALLRAYLDAHLDRGRRGAYVWVLADRPAARFYARAGARFDGASRRDDVDGVDRLLHRYVWDDLEIAR